MYAVKVASSDNLDIIYLIFGNVVRFVILDPSNHTYKTESGGVPMWGVGVGGVWVEVSMGIGWGVWGWVCACGMTCDTSTVVILLCNNHFLNISAKFSFSKHRIELI